MTAEDVAFTFNDVVAKVHPRASRWWNNVVSAEDESEHRFAITLKEPFAPFLTLLGNRLGSGTLILPKHIYEGTDPRTNPANRKPIGSGPFKLADWQPGSYIALERNNDYFKPGLPHLDRLVFQIAPDASTRLLAFERGEIDFLHAYIVPYEAVGRLREDPRFRVMERGLEAAATNENLLFNLRHRKLKDERVRRALAFAIDRKAIIDGALFGLGRVAHSHINSGLGWVHAGGFDDYDPRDLSKAEALLDAAGFERGVNGVRFGLRLTHDAWKRHRTARGRDYPRQLAGGRHRGHGGAIRPTHLCRAHVSRLGFRHGAPELRHGAPTSAAYERDTYSAGTHPSYRSAVHGLLGNPCTPEARGDGTARTPPNRERTGSASRIMYCNADSPSATAVLLALSTYLGHTHISDTYWYLEATPTLMQDIASSCEAFIQREKQ